jgi:hypothetical protein
MEKRLKLKRYVRFVAESLDPSKFDNIIGDVRNMIKSTIENSSDYDGIDSFIDDFLRDPDGVKIDGLVMDDQVYDFWVNYKNEIDEILNDVKFFDNSPTDIKEIGTYKYLIACTRKAIELVVTMIKDGR